MPDPADGGAALPLGEQLDGPSAATGAEHVITGEGRATMKPATDFPVDLTNEQVAFFRDNGFLSIDRITTDDEVEWLRGIYDRLFTERLGEEKGEYFDLGGPRAHDGREVLPQVLGPERKFPELKETIHYRDAHRLAAKLLGVDEAEISGGGHMILKPPR